MSKRTSTTIIEQLVNNIDGGKNNDKDVYSNIEKGEVLFTRSETFIHTLMNEIMDYFQCLFDTNSSYKSYTIIVLSMIIIIISLSLWRTIRSNK